MCFPAISCGWVERSWSPAAAAAIFVLARIRDLEPRRLWPGHGPAIESPEKLIAEYVAHRETRDAQILAALRDGRATPAEIVRVVYAFLPPALLPAAEDSALAHLKKLLDEGRVVLEGDNWRVV